MEEIKVIKVINDGSKIVTDFVAKEVPVTIFYNQEELITLLCSPFDLKELTIGFLYSSGLINGVADIENISEDTQKWIVFVKTKNKIDIKELTYKRVFTSGCGRGTLFYNAVDLLHRKKIKTDFKISTEDIFYLIAKFNKPGENFKKTGCTHSSGLSEGKNILVLKEDIGRHNAVDKVIGECIIKNINMKKSVLFTSGRVSSEIIFKLIKAEIPIIVSHSAPTDQAIKLARESGITLICFARGKKMNIYSVIGSHTVYGMKVKAC